MARLARVVVPGVPHRLTERGNRRQEMFFSEADDATYLAEGLGPEQAALLRRHEHTGRPLGSVASGDPPRSHPAQETARPKAQNKSELIMMRL